MRILDRLPIYVEKSLITVQGDPLEVYRNQIIVWLSFGDTQRTFPAILDTGLSHNLSMAQRHVQRWIRLELPKIGRSKIGPLTIDQFAADVSIHKNEACTRELGQPFPLEMEEGIAIFPDGLPITPRLPILGLRTILKNKLKLIVDGERGQVTLKKGWL